MKHRVAVETRHAAPRNRRLLVNQGTDTAIADQSEVQGGWCAQSGWYSVRRFCTHGFTLSLFWSNFDTNAACDAAKMGLVSRALNPSYPADQPNTNNKR
jgi:hypothetical protein